MNLNKLVLSLMVISATFAACAMESDLDDNTASSSTATDSNTGSQQKRTIRQFAKEQSERAQAAGSAALATVKANKAIAAGTTAGVLGLGAIVAYFRTQIADQYNKVSTRTKAIVAGGSAATAATAAAAWFGRHFIARKANEGKTAVVTEWTKPGYVGKAKVVAAATAVTAAIGGAAYGAYKFFAGSKPSYETAFAGFYGSLSTEVLEAFVDQAEAFAKNPTLMVENDKFFSALTEEQRAEVLTLVEMFVAQQPAVEQVAAK